MIKIYFKTNCGSSRKVLEWFNRYHVDCNYKNINRSILTREELIEILSKSDNGVSDIIATRSQKFREIKKANIKINNLSMCELINLIINNHDLLKMPIIVGKKSIHAGYNPEEIGRFLPVEKRDSYALNKEY